MRIWLQENALCYAAEPLGNVSFQNHGVKCNDITPFTSMCDLGKGKKRKESKKSSDLCFWNFHVQVSLLGGAPRKIR